MVLTCLAQENGLIRVGPVFSGLLPEEEAPVGGVAEGDFLLPDSVGQLDFENDGYPAALLPGRRLHQETVVDFGQVEWACPRRAFQELVGATPGTVHGLDDRLEVVQGCIGVRLRVVDAEMVEHRLVDEAIPAVRDSTAVIQDRLVLRVVAAVPLPAGVTGATAGRPNPFRKLDCALSRRRLTNASRGCR